MVRIASGSESLGAAITFLLLAAGALSPASAACAGRQTRSLDGTGQPEERSGFLGLRSLFLKCGSPCDKTAFFSGCPWSCHKCVALAWTNPGDATMVCASSADRSEDLELAMKQRVHEEG